MIYPYKKHDLMRSLAQCLVVHVHQVWSRQTFSLITLKKLPFSQLCMTDGRSYFPVEMRDRVCESESLTSVVLCQILLFFRYPLLTLEPFSRQYLLCIIMTQRITGDGAKCAGEIRSEARRTGMSGRGTSFYRSVSWRCGSTRAVGVGIGVYIATELQQMLQSLHLLIITRNS